MHLAEAFGVSMEEGRPGDATRIEVKEEALRQELSGILPIARDQLRELSALAARFRDALPLGGQALGEVILDADTELAVLAKIKEHGKELSTATDSEVERDVGLTVYFAALAGALLYHGERITSYSYAAMADAFNRLAAKRWMEPRLARHFSKAARECKERAK